MTRQDAQPDREPMTQPTRRDAMKVGGGIALALLGAGLGTGTVAFAQQATPVSGSLDGAYTVVRLYTVRADRSSDELLALIRDGYVPLIREIPGFISYTAIADPASAQHAFISVFEDKAGADESTRLAREWVADNDIDHFDEGPTIAEGVIAFSIGAEAGT